MKESLSFKDFEVHNLTEDLLTDEEKEALAYGIHFVPNPPLNRYLVQEAYEKFATSERLKHYFRDRELIDGQIISPFYQSTGWTVPPRLRDPELEERLLSLKKDLAKVPFRRYTGNWDRKKNETLTRLLAKPDRLVITADKNLGYCYTSVEVYRRMALKHLNDRATYVNVSSTVLSSDNGASWMQKLYQKMEVLVTDHIRDLEEEECKFIMKIKKYKLMRFYVLAKVHKTSDPNRIQGRPIVPCIGWVTHNLAVWISVELQKYISGATTVLRDSTELVRRLQWPSLKKKIQKAKSAIWLVTADVVALYPSITRSKCLAAVSEFLDSQHYPSDERKEFLLRALTFVMNNVIVMFESAAHLMVSGIGMGASCSPEVANIYMYMLEKRAVEELSNTVLLDYKRFIDDSFMIVGGNETDISAVLEKLNDLDPRIQFTHQSSRCNVDFLDLSIHYHRKSKTFETRVYQKPLNKYAYLPYTSYHTRAQKMAFIKGEAIRYAKFSSRECHYKEMIEAFVIRLRKRGYPDAFIEVALSDVSWSRRQEYLEHKPKRVGLPRLFKIQYNPGYDPRGVRRCLDKFSEGSAIKRKITICYTLPSKLHRRILKSRKEKGF